MLAMYEDFQQKNHFAKLTKLMHERSQLPIASYKDELVEAVRRNPVVVLAGMLRLQRPFV